MDRFILPQSFIDFGKFTLPKNCGKFLLSIYANKVVIRYDIGS